MINFRQVADTAATSPAPAETARDHSRPATGTPRPEVVPPRRDGTTDAHGRPLPSYHRLAD